MPLVQKRRRAPAAEEAPEASDVEHEAPRQRRRQSAASEHDEFTQTVMGATQGDSNMEQMVKNLVRLALACEYSRTPIRRTEINAKVLGVQTRQFKTVFGEAQTQLRVVFGMEMTELPLREKVTLAQRRAAQKSQSAQKTSGAWVLTSMLPPRFRVPEILPPPQAPTAEAESQYIALYTFVISLILLSGGTLPDGKLDRYLSRVNVDETTPLAYSAAYSGMDKTEKLLKRMEKDGYIVKIRDTSTGEETIDWTVGQRGKVEVGEGGVTGLVKTVYGDLEEDDATDLQRRVDRSLGLAEKDLQRRVDRSLGLAEKKTQATQPQPGERSKGRRKRSGVQAGGEDEDGEGESSEGE